MWGPGTQGLAFVKSLDGREGTGCFVPITLLMPAACSRARMLALVISKLGPETSPQRQQMAKRVEPPEFWR